MQKGSKGNIIYKTGSFANRLDALISYHDSLAGGGQLGIDKVKSSLIQKYYWPKMHKDITEYV